ncbi:ER protein BIG1 [Apiospora phragmitis]|uniref:Protein BIG1 n=1 Tax=Apiospora phragmitis TaxID=2905665 RepID=A0ABR1T527_9PEZI
MHFSSTAAVAALCCAEAQAFSNTSPFLLFSTSKLSDSAIHDQAQIQSSASVTKLATDILSTCPTERYLIVTQPNLHASHLRSATSAPRLQHTLKSAQVASRVTVAEVAGALDTKALSKLIKASCGKEASVDEVALEAIPTTSSDDETLKENDDDLAVVLAQYEAEGSFTVVYAGVPQAADEKEQNSRYEAQFVDAARVELKRDLGNGVYRRANETDKRPLFEKYQFFTPGIFMGLIAVIVLMSILGAGISALSSLEVSYSAFDKDMGPTAQKKQQ